VTVIERATDDRDHDHWHDVRPGLDKRERRGRTTREEPLRRIDHDGIGQREADAHERDRDQPDAE
jgi:hypothetical protein